MSITAAKVVKIARSHIGMREHGNNLTKWGADYGLNGAPWCGVHVWAVFKEAGVNLRDEGISGSASTNLLDLQLRRKGWQRISRYGIRPGDIVFFDFGVVAPGDPANDDDHVGIASKRCYGINVTTIDGNTSPGVRGSQANGDGVYQRTRPASLVRHAYRPPYKALTARMVARAKAAAAVKARTAAAKKAAEVAAHKAAQARAAAAKRALANKAAARKAAAAAAVALVVGGGAASHVVAEKPAATVKPASTVTASPSRSPYAPPTTHLVVPDPTPAQRVTLSRTLRVQRPVMRGRDVAEVRKLLGVRPGTLYTPKVAAVVKRWQKAHGLKPADGEFGRQSARRAGWGYR